MNAVSVVHAGKDAQRKELAEGIQSGEPAQMQLLHAAVSRLCQIPASIIQIPRCVKQQNGDEERHEFLGSKHLAEGRRNLPGWGVPPIDGIVTCERDFQQNDPLDEKQQRANDIDALKPEDLVCRGGQGGNHGAADQRNEHG